MRRSAVPTLIAVLVLAQPLAARATFGRTVTASTSVGSGTLLPASGITLSKACGLVFLDPADVTVSWTATASAFATGYTVILVANGIPQAPRAVAGRATTSTTFQVTRGVVYTAIVITTFKNWTSPLASTATTTICGLL